MSIKISTKTTFVSPLGSKNLGRLWLAYTELQSDFCMLQFISVDSRQFTQSELSLGWSDLHEIKNVSFSAPLHTVRIQTHTSIKQGCGLSLTPSVKEKDHGHLWVQCALHS